MLAVARAIRSMPWEASSPPFWPAIAAETTRSDCSTEVCTFAATSWTLAENWRMAEAICSVVPCSVSPLRAICSVVADICSEEADSSVAPLATEAEAWDTRPRVCRNCPSMVFREAPSWLISSWPSTRASTRRSPFATSLSSPAKAWTGRVMLRVMTMAAPMPASIARPERSTMEITAFR